MDLDNQLHGHLVAAVFEVLLADAGYQVVPLGIERSVRELRAVSAVDYTALIHRRLRSIPDFFVLDTDARKSWLTEVKYRPYIHRRLADDLVVVQREWSPFTLILAVAEPPGEWTGVIRHIRVFEVNAATELDKGFFAQAGMRLQDVFVRLAEKWEVATIEKAQQAILRIASR